MIFAEDPTETTAFLYLYISLTGEEADIMWQCLFSAFLSIQAYELFSDILVLVFNALPF